MTDNGEKAKTERANYARWEATISAAPEGEIIAQAEDAAGNLEPLSHRVSVEHGHSE